MDKHGETDKRRTRRTFTPEFKAEAVRLCKFGDRGIARFASDLDLIETSAQHGFVRYWNSAVLSIGIVTPDVAMRMDDRRCGAGIYVEPKRGGAASVQRRCGSVLTDTSSAS